MLDYTPSFICKKRSNATYFYSLTDPPDKDLSDLIRSIHEHITPGTLPNDWIYAQIYHAFERLQECESDSDYERALSEIEGDVYTSELLEWAKHGYAQHHIQQTLDDIDKPESIDSLIRITQCLVIDDIYSYVWEFLKGKMKELNIYKGEGDGDSFTPN